MENKSLVDLYHDRLDEKYARMRYELRYNRLMGNGKNIKTPGVLRKLRRQLRNLGVEVE